MRERICNPIVSTSNMCNHDMNVKLCSPKAQRYNILTKVIVSGGTLTPNVTNRLVIAVKKQFLLLPEVAPCIDCSSYGKQLFPHNIFIECHKCTKEQLLSLIDRLSFACKVVPAGRIFSRRLIDLSYSVSRIHHHIWPTKETHLEMY